jgi:hypothetical protein
MRKRLIGADGGGKDDGEWLDLAQVAQVELTSEDPDHPIEAALRGAPGHGWRAATPGPQAIRLIFDQPQRLRRIHLTFQEEATPRTQEFSLRWSPDGGQSYRDVQRQQYTFSPPGTTRQVEDYKVDLAGVTLLVLQIVPDIGGGRAHASLAALRLA